MTDKAQPADKKSATGAAPLGREAVARCMVLHDPNYSTYHMPGDAPRKWKAASGAVYNTSELSEGCAEQVRVRADAILSLQSNTKPDGSEA